MTDIGPEQCQPALQLFSAPEASYVELVARAWALGNAPGRLWVDDPERPSLSLLWDSGSCCYLAGELGNAAASRALAGLVRRTLWSRARRDHGLFLKVEASSPLDDAFVRDSFPGASLRPSDRVLLSSNSISASSSAVRPPEPTPLGSAVPGKEATLHWIDAALLGATGLRNHERLLAEIRCCWPSLDRFLEQSFGVCVVGGGELCAWCTGEYRAGQSIGIGIETVAEHQRRGYATMAASAFLQRCRSEGLCAYWDAWTANAASVRVAEKVGLSPANRYQAYAGVLAP